MSQETASFISEKTRCGIEKQLNKYSQIKLNTLWQSWILGIENTQEMKIHSFTFALILLYYFC